MLSTTRLASMVLIVLGAAASSAGDGQEPEAPYSFSYPEDPAYLVLQYRSLEPRVPERYDAIPLVRLYGDGRLLVHRPADWKQAGDYELMLSKRRFQELLEALASSGLLSLSTEEIIATRGEVLEVFTREHNKSGYGAPVPGTEIRINLENFKGSGIDGGYVKTLLCLPGLYEFTEEYNLLRKKYWGPGEVTPYSEVLDGVYRGVARLQKLIYREDLVPTATPFPKIGPDDEHYISACFR